MLQSDFHDERLCDVSGGVAFGARWALLIRLGVLQSCRREDKFLCSIVTLLREQTV